MHMSTMTILFLFVIIISAYIHLTAAGHSTQVFLNIFGDLSSFLETFSFTGKLIVQFECKEKRLVKPLIFATKCLFPMK